MCWQRPRRRPLLRQVHVQRLQQLCRRADHDADEAARLELLDTRRGSPIMALPGTASDVADAADDGGGAAGMAAGADAAGSSGADAAGWSTGVLGAAGAEGRKPMSICSRQISLAMNDELSVAMYSSSRTLSSLARFPDCSASRRSNQSWLTTGDSVGILNTGQGSAPLHHGRLGARGV